jgi:hypothetical protein
VSEEQDRRTPIHDKVVQEIVEHPLDHVRAGRQQAEEELRQGDSTSDPK